jgi:nucleotidyltransferase/DNA polymerase involved in DNA repair
VPRIAALRIPRFPIAAHWLQLERPADQPWDQQPVALLQSGRLACVSAAAARRQVRRGMTAAQAKAACAELELLPWDAPLLARETARTTAALLTASPQVAPVPDEPGLWWVGAEGFDALGGEALLAAALRDIARVWHPQARVAVADTAVAARAATWSRALVGAQSGAAASVSTSTNGDAAPQLIPPGSDAAFLARVPLTLLPMDTAMREALRTLGITQAGGLAALDASDVERRWGASGVAAWRLARGDDPRRAPLLRGDPRRGASTTLDTSTTSREPLLFVLRGALERLVPALRQEGRAIAALAITLTLDDGRPEHHITREARPARPLARVAPLFERCRALLEDWPLPAPVQALSVHVAATAPLSGEQGDLLRPAWRDPGAAEAALARLQAAGVQLLAGRRVDRWGAERAGVWASATTVPEDGARTADMTATPQAQTPAATSTTLPPALHRFLPTPEPVTVHCEAGRPVAAELSDGPMRFLTAVGPERIAGEWWTGEARGRDYWRCLEAGAPHRELLLVCEGAGEGAEGAATTTRWHLLGWRD